MSEDNTDYLGHALELESASKKVESQTAERAMLAGAHCLRIAEAARKARLADMNTGAAASQDERAIIMPLMDIIYGQERIGYSANAVRAAIRADRAALPAQAAAVDLRPHLEWALRGIEPINQGDRYAAARAALDAAQAGPSVAEQIQAAAGQILRDAQRPDDIEYADDEQADALAAPVQGVAPTVMHECCMDGMPCQGCELRGVVAKDVAPSDAREAVHAALFALYDKELYHEPWERTEARCFIEEAAEQKGFIPLAGPDEHPAGPYLCSAGALIDMVEAARAQGQADVWGMNAAQPAAQPADAQQAVTYVIRRAQRDARLASLIGPGTQCWEVLTEAAALAAGREVDEYRAAIEKTLRYERWPGAGDIEDRINQAVEAARTEWEASRG